MADDMFDEYVEMGFDGAAVAWIAEAVLARVMVAGNGDEDLR